MRRIEKNAPKASSGFEPGGRFTKGIDSIGTGKFLQNEGKKSQDVKFRQAEQRQRFAKSFTMEGSVEDDELTKEIEDKLANLELDMVKFVDQGQIWLDRNKGKNTNQGIDRMNKMYQRRMLLMTLAPLRDGADMEAIVNVAVGFGILAMCNPDIRKSLQGGMADVCDALAEAHSGNEARSARLKMKADKYRAASNDGRVPFTVESAALMDLQLTRDVYNKMREPGADVDALAIEQKEAREMLFALAEADGVSSTEILKSENLMLARCARKDPTFAKMFEEISYDNVRPAPGKTKKVYTYDDNGRAVPKTIKVWSGDFVDENGIRMDEPFTSRKPLKEADAKAMLKDTIEKVYEDMILSGEGYGTFDAQTMIDARSTVNDALDMASELSVEEASGKPYYREMYEQKYSPEFLDYMEEIKRVTDFMVVDNFSPDQVDKCMNLAFSEVQADVVSKTLFANAYDDTVYQYSEPTIAFAVENIDVDLNTEEGQKYTKEFIDSCLAKKRAEYMDMYEKMDEEIYQKKFEEEVEAAKKEKRKPKEVHVFDTPRQAKAEWNARYRTMDKLLGDMGQSLNFVVRSYDTCCKSAYNTGLPKDIVANNIVSVNNANSLAWASNNDPNFDYEDFRRDRYYEHKEIKDFCDKYKEAHKDELSFIAEEEYHEDSHFKHKEYKDGEGYRAPKIKIKKDVKDYYREKYAEDSFNEIFIDYGDKYEAEGETVYGF